LIFVLYRKAFVVKAWELVLAILVASFVGRLAMLFFGDSFAGIAVGYFYSVPGLVVSGLLSILLLKAMDRVERLG
jgi:glucose uptake protein GlcU